MKDLESIKQLKSPKGKSMITEPSQGAKTVKKDSLSL